MESIAAIALLATGIGFQGSIAGAQQQKLPAVPKPGMDGSTGPETGKPTTSSGSNGTSPTIASTTSTSAAMAPIAEPGGGYALFPGKRIVAFYGAPGGGNLGVLGQNTPSAMWPKLMAQMVPYQQPNVTTLAAYELITYIAQGSPQPDGTYSRRLSNSTIERYLNVVRQHDGLLILDIQPGRGSFLADARTLAPFLDQPDVALALDPEWKVDTQQIPGRVIGSATAAQINSVSAWLEDLVVADHLPQKLLLIHEFTESMIQDKPGILSQSHLATVFNMDGFGSWKAKSKAYGILSADSRFYLGFKLFYNQDAPLALPSQVLGLDPQPVIIEYE